MPRIDAPSSPIPGKLEGLHLFHFDAAPCAQRVRFALGEKGLHRGREEKFDATTPGSTRGEAGKWVSRIVSLSRKDHISATYAAIHPNMVVPALVHEGVLHLESMDIIAYLDDAFGGDPLVPTQPEARAATLARVDEAKVLHRSIRYVTFHWGLGRLAMLNPKENAQLAELASQGNDEEKLVDFYRGYSTGGIPASVYEDHLLKLYTAFVEVDRELQDGRQFLMGDEVTIADPFWSMKLLRLSECGYPTADLHPTLHAWYQRVAARPSFRHEVMGRNHLMHGAFKAKAALETILGIGLRQAVRKLAA